MKTLVLSLLAIMTAASLQAQDLALSGPFGTIVSPSSGCSLTSTETVTIRIFNFGPDIPAGTPFDASYTVNGGTLFKEFIMLGSPLLSNSSYSYTFITKADLSTPGTYTFTATVNLPGDINPNNNNFTNYLVTNGANSVGGAISGSTTACASGNSGTLTLSGYTGNILRWEYSNDNGNTWYYISNTSATQNYSNLESTTSYRAVVQNLACGIAFSTIATITINC